MRQHAEDDYIIAKIRTTLATDDRVNKQDIRIAIRGGCVHLMGLTSTDERRRLVGEIVSELFPDWRVCNELTVTKVGDAGEPELLS